MNMRLSYRDKVIFIAVVVFAILLGGFLIFVKAKINESQDIKNALTQKEKEKADVDAKIDTLEGLQKELEDSIKEVNDVQEMFFDEQESFEADQYLYELLKDTGIRFETMMLTGETEEDISEYFYTRNSVAYDIKINSDLTGDSLDQEVYDKYYGTYPAPAPDVEIAIEQATFTISVETDASGAPLWEPVNAAIDLISQHEKTLYLRELSSAGAEEVRDSQGNIVDSYALFKFVVDIYSIEHMNTDNV